MYDNIPPIMSREECQNILKIGKSSMLELIHSGMIDAFLIKGSFRITREALEEFIEHNQF